MQAALKSFATAVDPQNRKLIVLVLDQAGWHMSKKLEVPSNILLIPLPAYTPELSPAELLVNKLKIPLANKTLTTLEEIERLLSEECVRLKESCAEVRSLTRFPWIRDVLESL